MKKRPVEYLDEFPEALNPELYKTHIDFEAEEKLIKEEERLKKQERKQAGKKRIKSLFNGF